MASTARQRRSWKKILLWAIGIAVVVFIAIQFVPYGRSSHSNPPADQPLPVDRPAGRGDRQGVVLRLPQQRDEVVVGDQHRAVLLAGAARRGRGTLAPQLLGLEQPAGRGGPGDRQRGRDAAVPVHADPPRRQAHRRREADARPGVRGRASRRAAARRADARRRAHRRRPTAAAADAVAIINQRCSTCHSADPALSFRTGSTAEAQALVDDMIQRGAQVTAEEKQALVQYFTQ